MDYKRIYNLCLLGIGVLFFIQAIPDILTGGLDITVILVFVGGAGIVTSTLYSLGRPEAANGPTEPNLVFWAIVLSFVLVFAGTVLSFV